MINIQELIDKKLSEKQKKEPVRDKGGKLSPSMLGRCHRLQYWTATMETPSDPPDSRTLRVFEAGHIFHDYVQRYLPDHQTEVVIEDEFCKGRADIVLEDAVLDIKTQHSQGFHYMKKPSYDIYKEKRGNWMQVAWYALHAGKDNCGLVFISKDDLCIEQYFAPAKKWETELKTEIDTLTGYLKRTEVPPAAPQAKWECGYCNYATKCQKGGVV